MDCMTEFSLVAAIGLKEITSYHVTWWSFGNFFFPFGLTKMIIVDADGLFDGMFKKNFQETLPIPVHEIARGNHKAVINEGFH